MLWGVSGEGLFISDFKRLFSNTNRKIVLEYAEGLTAFNENQNKKNALYDYLKNQTLTATK